MSCSRRNAVFGYFKRRTETEFRSISKRLLDGVQRSTREEVLQVFGWWKSGMHNHEGYEEYKLYPYLARRYGIDFDPLIEGHAELSEACTEVYEGVDLRAALTRHDQVLHAHLALEEDIVIPALLELTPEEFRRFTGAPASG